MFYMSERRRAAAPGGEDCRAPAPPIFVAGYVVFGEEVTAGLHSCVPVTLGRGQTPSAGTSDTPLCTISTAVPRGQLQTSVLKLSTADSLMCFLYNHHSEITNTP